MCVSRRQRRLTPQIQEDTTMRTLPLLLAVTASAGLAAACAHAQINTPDGAGEAAPLCQLHLLQGGAGRELVAEAMPDLPGHWTLEAGGPAMMIEQSGALSDRPEGDAELTRLLLASASGPAPGLDELRPGQTVMGGSEPHPIFAVLRVEDEAGQLICEARVD